MRLMIQQTITNACRMVVMLSTLPAIAFAQKPPYDVFPPADPPYYRVRYEASTRPGELVYAVNYTIWIPDNVKSLRGVIVHQHGCGEGSCKSGLTGAYDLHWQALARKHHCAFLAPSYEQPGKADCQMWCDPRNGSSAAFQKCLVDLGAKSGHKGGLIGVAIDPLTSHECGNQRYFAIPWLDACLSARLPKVSGDPLIAMPTDSAWLAPVTGSKAVPAAAFADDPLKATWLPNEAMAQARLLTEGKGCQHHLRDLQGTEKSSDIGPTRS